MTRRQPDALAPDVVLGGVLLLIGSLLFFDKLNLVTIGQILSYWPIGLIGGGTALLVQHFDGRDRVQEGVAEAAAARDRFLERD